ncbi:MAG: hypothetical protein AAGG61_03610, partial [Methanothrix soehngenii]|uniref:hypothetical protein n=1 Tax=Methanothrix soehngenii TaxID=2223 RepID=UPI003141F072
SQDREGTAGEYGAAITELPRRMRPIESRDRSLFLSPDSCKYWEIWAFFPPLLPLAMSSYINKSFLL